MTLDEFVSFWDGKPCEIAGLNAKDQCVDLANQYIQDVLGHPIIIGTNAKDFPTKDTTNYEYILNTPTGVPEKGDLVIWDGVYGHIAIFIQGDANSFRSFDQNWPTGSKCHVQNHASYLHVKGWMHPKSSALTECLNQHTMLVNLCNTKDDKIKELEQKLTEVEAAKSSLTAENDKLIKTNRENDTKIIQMTAADTEWNVLKGMYPIKCATDMDAIVRSIKEELSASQTGKVDSGLLKTCKLELRNALKESVKTVSKRRLLSEYVSRFFPKKHV